MRPALLLALASIGAGCGAPGARHARCGAFDACSRGLECVHAGAANLGTCESRCESEEDCPASFHCAAFPPPDALPPICVQGLRAVADEVVLLDVVPQPDGLELVGETERNRDYALVGAAPDRGLARVLGPATTECDHCLAPRSTAWAVLPPSRAPLIAVGPVREPLPHARAHPEPAFPPSARWARTLGVDLDGDGRVDVERVARCEHTVRAGCGPEEVCDRVCYATRTAGAEAVRAVMCRSFMPDFVDCEPAPP